MWFSRWEAGTALGLHVEVGFEALLPVYLGWLDHLAGDRETAMRRMAETLEAVVRRAAPRRLLDALIEDGCRSRGACSPSTS